MRRVSLLVVLMCALVAARISGDMSRRGIVSLSLSVSVLNLLIRWLRRFAGLLVAISDRLSIVSTRRYFALIIALGYDPFN